MLRYLEKAWQFHRPLTAATLLSLLLIIVPLVGMVADPKTITGVNAWFKPLKFAIASVIYAGSFLFLLTFVRGRRRLAEVLGGVTGFVVVFETLLIMMQVVRGTTSHFNATTPFDAAVFSSMAVAITILALMNLALGILLLRQQMPDPAIASGLRLGVFVSFIGMLVAFLMTSPTPEQLEAMRNGAEVALVGAHSVGVADGGPGIPFLGWSTEGGDLRVPHFVGIHGMQVLALLGWLLARSVVRDRWNARERLSLARLGGAAYLGWVALLTWQALRGQSVVEADSLTVVAYVALILPTCFMAMWIASRRNRNESPGDATRPPQPPRQTTGASMKRRTTPLIALVFALAAPFDTAAADEPELPPLTIEPAPPPQLTYGEFRVQELERGVRRSRNALIGTSVAAAVGLALVIPAAGQCESVEVDGNTDYECTRAGSALLGVGSPLVVGGLTGAVVSGIILGVRKGKLRRMNDTFSYPKSRAVRWDERASRLVF